MTDLRKAAEQTLFDLGATGSTSTAGTTRQALAQPEQEPVAWVYNGILHEFDPSEFATSEVKPLYTAPPKREWVGLTDDEIDTWNIVGHESLREFVRAIEAKLKEKNGG